MQQQTQAGQLAEAAIGGDEAAFAELVRDCRSRMFAAAIAITRNDQDASDAVQDAILRAWRKLPTIKQPQYVGTWMTRIAINCAINISKRRKPNAPLIEEIPAPGTDLAQKMDVRRAVDGLDENTRICTMLYYLEDVPINEIAEIVGARPGTVKSRLFRAREKLREVLKDYER